MDNKITIDGFGASVRLDIDYFTLSNLTQASLLEAAHQIEHFKDPEDIEVWEALMVVIPYFSTPDQIKDLANYQADPDWINIVATKAA